MNRFVSSTHCILSSLVECLDFMDQHRRDDCYALQGISIRMRLIWKNSSLQICYDLIHRVPAKTRMCRKDWANFLVDTWASVVAVIERGLAVEGGGPSTEVDLRRWRMEDSVPSNWARGPKRLSRAAIGDEKLQFTAEKLVFSSLFFFFKLLFSSSFCIFSIFCYATSRLKITSESPWPSSTRFQKLLITWIVLMMVQVNRTC